MKTVTVSEKGQLVIPIELRRLLGISTGTRLNLTADGSGFKAEIDPEGKTLNIRDVVGITNYMGEPVKIEDMRVTDYKG